MPGIVGVLKKNSKKNSFSNKIFVNMLDRIKPSNGAHSEVLENKELGFVFGLTYFKYFFEKKICYLKKYKDKDICFYGEVYNRDLDTLCEIDSWVQDADGIFVIIEIDYNKRLIKIATDKFGLLPIYFYASDEIFCFSTHIRPLLITPELKKRIDYSAIADFYHFGHVLGNKTLFEDIKLLSPSSILEYSIGRNNLNIKPYWDLLNLFSKEQKYNKDLEAEIVNEFKNSVEKRLNHLDALGISLSGGLDSRAILAAMGNKSKGVYSYTLGLKGCEDEKLAYKMAKSCETRHTFLEIKKQDLSNFTELARTLIFFSDGFYHPHESTEKVALDYLKRAPFKFLLRGHGGEIAKAALAYPVQCEPEVFRLSSFSKVVDYIFKKANLVVGEEELSRFLTPKTLKSIKGCARDSLEQEMMKCGDSILLPDILIYYYIDQWIRRQVVSSLSIFREYVVVRMPYIDEGFLRKLLILPIKYRFSGEIHFKIIKECNPNLIKIPNSNTGAPLDAGPIRLFFTDKFNSLMKKLSIPGFRHYTEFEKWHREFFKDSIQKILFDKKTLDRGLYEPKGLRDLFESHIQGKKDYARFLGTIVGLEIWFRTFID